MILINHNYLYIINISSHIPCRKDLARNLLFRSSRLMSEFSAMNHGKGDKRALSGARFRIHYGGAGILTILRGDWKQMKRMIILATAMVLMMGMAVTPVLAADATAAIDINSAYVWRGQTFNDGLVIQPSIDVAAGNGLGINVWGNYDISNYDHAVESNAFSEIDLTLSYSKTIGIADVGLGVISYQFPAGAPETTELYLSLGVPIVGGLSGGLNIYYDIEALYAFSYANLSLTYAYAFNDKLKLEAGGAIGYAGKDFSQAAGGDDGGLYDYSLSVSLGYTISKAWSASAKVTYVDALDSDNLKEVKDGGLLDTHTICGVSIAYTF
jgi:hypothetical protein